MENKNFISGNVSARLEALEASVRMRDLETKSVDCALNEETSELISYLRTGRYESKGLLGYGVEGLSMAVDSVGKIFDNIGRFYPLLANMNIIKTDKPMVALNVVKPGTPSSVVWDDGKQERPDSTLDAKFETVKLELKTCLAVIDVSKQVIEDMSDSNLLQWIQDKVNADMANAFIDAIIKGEQGNMQQMLKDVKSGDLLKAKLVAGLLEMIGDLNDDLQIEAAWYMNSATFGALMEIASADGQSFLFRHLTPSTREGAAYNLFGKPLYVVKQLDANQVLLANLKEGYTLIQHSNAQLLHQQADAYVNKVRYIYKRRVAGAVTNKAAFVLRAIK